jgi:hypothetical protein
MEIEPLRTASSLRFVFTKKKKEVNVIEVKKIPDINGEKIRKTPGRRQSEGVRKKVEKDQDGQKKKAEWGKAFKYIQGDIPPVHEIFLNISETKECSSDPFYLKVFREMAYGSFPKGIFYDSNRDTLVCTEAPGKRNQAVRRKKFEKYVRVCLPLRPQVDFESRTTLISREDTTHNENDQSELINDVDIMIDDDDDKESIAAEDSFNRKVIKYIHRSYQRLELPIKILKENFMLSFERIYQEIKLFIYMTIDVLSPKDSILLQDDSYQSIQTGEFISSLKPQKPWKKLSRIEQVSLLCQYCRSEFIRSSNHLTLGSLTPTQLNLLRDIEDFVIGMYHTGVLTSDTVEYDGNNIHCIRGITIHFRSGLIIDNEKLIKTSSQTDCQNISPIPIQVYKSVDLQKITNSITKQSCKHSKMVQDLTGVLDDDENSL